MLWDITARRRAKRCSLPHLLIRLERNKMLKVLKFGGSSLADSSQFAKVKEIVESESSREVVVVSAPGKRNSDDNKITDLLYLVHAHIKYGVAHDGVLSMIKKRYSEIRKGCGLETDIESIIDETFASVNKKTPVDFIASRGEYFSARLMAEYLGYQFVDAVDWLCFEYNGKVFGTQTVIKGEKVIKPKLKPAASGSWNWDFNKEITEDTVIEWK